MQKDSISIVPITPEVEEQQVTIPIQHGTHPAIEVEQQEDCPSSDMMLMTLHGGTLSEKKGKDLIAEHTICTQVPRQLDGIAPHMRSFSSFVPLIR
mmetsp:Transcript_4242/g.6794  ORF Transcript_4242/g.6794 Transcript_4242/m.6794 type:complete len:96 (-) Transcript_4242:13403-13690(-)